MVSLSTKRGARGLRADINVTPLVDVVLVLLIIFMVITPLLHASRELKLPAARAAAAGSPGEPLVLSVTADRMLWLANEPVSEQKLTAALSRRAGQELLIRADTSLSMRELRPLLRLVKTAGLSRLAFAVTPARPE